MSPGVPRAPTSSSRSRRPSPIDTSMPYASARAASTASSTSPFAALNALDTLWNKLEKHRRAPSRKTNYFKADDVAPNHTGVLCPDNANTLRVQLTPDQAQRTPLHANHVRLGQCYAVGQSPGGKFEEACTGDLIHSLDSGQGLFQFTSRNAHRVNINANDRTAAPTIADMLATQWKKSGPGMLLGERYAVDDFCIVHDHPKRSNVTRYQITACEIKNDRPDPATRKTVFITQAGLRFVNKLLQPEQIVHAAALFATHPQSTLPTAVDRQTHPQTGPLICSAAGIGRGAVLAVYQDLCSRMPGEVNQHTLDDALAAAIATGIDARGPKFLQSKAQLAALREALVAKINETPRAALPGQTRQRDLLNRLPPKRESRVAQPLENVTQASHAASSVPASPRPHQQASNATSAPVAPTIPVPSAASAASAASAKSPTPPPATLASSDEQIGNQVPPVSAQTNINRARQTELDRYTADRSTVPDVLELARLLATDEDVIAASRDMNERIQYAMKEMPTDPKRIVRNQKNIALHGSFLSKCINGVVDKWRRKNCYVIKNSEANSEASMPVLFERQPSCPPHSRTMVSNITGAAAPYLHANEIPLDSSITFIAAQRPLSNPAPGLDNSNVFWQTLLHEKVSLIVDLTEKKPSNESQELPYGPSKNQEKNIGSHVLRLSTEAAASPFLRTEKIEVRDVGNNKINNLTRTHFSGWNIETGISADTLLALAEQVARTQREQPGKVLIHGDHDDSRSGTLITLIAASEKIEQMLASRNRLPIADLTQLVIDIVVGGRIERGLDFVGAAQLPLIVEALLKKYFDSVDTNDLKAKKSTG